MKAFMLSMLFVSTSALAWGPTGHRAVGEIAEKYMDARALIAARNILQGQSLAKGSTWPDEIKSEPATYQYTYNWHYTDWADDAHEHDETNSSGKLMGSIDAQMAVLKSPTAKREEKAFALKFIVHLIGDLHMPLHVGNGLDQGGNFCKVSYMGQNTNLHALWDEGMINFTNLSFTELAKFVTAGKTIEQMRTARSGSPIDWARESKILRTQIYPPNVIEPQTPMSVRGYCRREATPEEMPKLSYDYAYKFMPVVEERIFLAGVRLSVLLNEALK